MRVEALSPFYGRVFGLEEIRNYFKEPVASIKVQLSRLCKKGILIRLKRNCYTFSKFPADSMLIGQQLVEPSYYSLEWVLSRRGVIPEGAVVYTLVTSQKTQRFSTPVGTFDYRHLPPGLFFGVEKREDGVWVASREKALLDHLYLNSARFKPDFACFQAERFDELEGLDWGKMREWALRYGMKKLVGLVDSLESYLKSDAYQEHR